MSTQPTAQWRVPEWTLADRLRKIRRLTGMPQGEFARAINVPEPRYAAWESGRNQPHSSDLLAVAKRIELLTQVPATWVLGLDTTNGPRPTMTWGEGHGLPRLDSDQQPSDVWSEGWDAISDVAWHEHEDGWGRAA